MEFITPTRATVEARELATAWAIFGI